MDLVIRNLPTDSCLIRFGDKPGEASIRWHDGVFELELHGEVFLRATQYEVRVRGEKVDPSAIYSALALFFWRVGVSDVLEKEGGISAVLEDLKSKHLLAEKGKANRNLGILDVLNSP
jgi:hypothetical protein